MNSELFSEHRIPNTSWIDKIVEGPSPYGSPKQFRTNSEHFSRAGARPPPWVRANVVPAVFATATAGRKRAVRWNGGEGVIGGEGWAGRARGCCGEDGGRGRLRRRWRGRRVFGVCKLFVDIQWSHQHPTPIFDRLCSVYVVVAPAGVCCGLCISIMFVVMCLSVAISFAFMCSVLV